MRRMRRASRAVRIPSPACSHNDGLIEAAALGLLEPAEQSALAERLASCATCRANYTLSASLADSLRQLIPAAETAADVDTTRESAFVADFRQRHAADEQRHGIAEEAVAGTRHPTGVAGRGGTVARTGQLVNVASGLAAALLLLVLVGGFWFLGPGRGREGSLGGQPPRPHATVIATPAYPSLPYRAGGIPTNCRGIASAASVGPLSGAVGEAPFWIGGFARSQATVELGTPQDPHVPYGWHGELTWAAQPGLTGKVTITGMNMSGGQPLWLQGSDGARQSVVLDPQAATSRSVGGQIWSTGALTVFVPGGGCYALQARWPGGGWVISFAAGNPGEPVATAQPTP